ncbi:FUSC family protein [Bdellovibrio sp. HCB185ZH]|uniref:FUSC family protein n=1 Tax=Bdellovibrio sp. HCB185ZH TaxID=3394235 RepID=UPI0039A77AAC
MAFVPSKTSFWGPLFSFDRSRLDIWVAARGAIAIGLSMLVGVWLNSNTIGMIVVLGALNACFSDNSDAYAFRAKRMARAAIVTVLLVFLASVSAGNFLVSLVLVTLLAFASGYLIVLDTVLADLGTVAIATFVVFGAHPMDPAQAFHLSLFALLGAGIQALLALMLWPFRRYRPERRALANFFVDLSTLCDLQFKPEEVPGGSAQSIHTQINLGAISQDSRPEGRRYRSLLTQGERLRLGILSLGRLKNRIERENPGNPSIEIIADFLAVEKSLLQKVSVIIRDEEQMQEARENLKSLEADTAKVRDNDYSNQSVFMRAVLSDALRQMESIVGQSRAVIELATRTTEAGMIESQRNENARHWRFRFRGVWATLRANFTFQSPGFRHALRMAICIAVGEIIGHQMSVDRSYWVPMTVAIVLKSDYASTFNRGLLRIGGTVLGLLLATALFHVMPEGHYWAIALMVVFGFLMRWVGQANYGIFAVSVSALVVILVAMTGVPPKDVIWARGVNTFLGGALAMFAYMLWPTWEKTQLSEVVARMLETYRRSFHSIATLSTGETPASVTERDQLRQQSRVARANYMASQDRYLRERGSTTVDREFLAGVTAAGNRFAHALVALESASPFALDSEQQKIFKTYAEKIESTLDNLSRALRGQDVSNNEYPDLRAANVELEKMRAEQDRYGLFFDETDRMTNSLNTLRELIVKRLLENRRAKSDLK